MSDHPYEIHKAENGKIVKTWTKGVLFEEQALQQLLRVTSLPFVKPYAAAMPDVHWGRGATVGSVIPTVKAIIPAAVGVDIGCGMAYVETDLDVSKLPSSLAKLRAAIEAAVPHGRTAHGNPNLDDGGWRNRPSEGARGTWAALEADYKKIVAKHPKIDGGATYHHVGTLGTGNHFIEVTFDENNKVGFMLHSGSRGPGNRIGSYFIELAKRDMERYFISLPDQDLAYLPEGSEHFDDYVEAVNWAQKFAAQSRIVMMNAVLEAAWKLLPPFQLVGEAINCHHNYIARENHFEQNFWITRKGAVRARKDDLGIIPGSMGASSFITRGLGNPESFMSSSHGAGRSMSRTEAKKRFTLQDHEKATKNVECRKDESVLDETPGAYKSIDKVMAAQSDLVEIVHTLKQLVCVKG